MHLCVRLLKYMKADNKLIVSVGRDVLDRRLTWDVSKI